jgi:hypothetical protein
MNNNILCTCVTCIYLHTCAHVLTDYFHGLAPVFTIQQLDQQIQINWHEGSYHTFEVLILHMPLHRCALVSHDQSQKNSNNV